MCSISGYSVSTLATPPSPPPIISTCYNEAEDGEDFTGTLTKIHDRFADIIRELGVDFDLEQEITILKKHLEQNPSPDYMASRGEYLNSKIIASYLGYTFIDAAEVIFFQENGALDEQKTYQTLAMRLMGADHAVVPGFYGALPDGTIHTFSRGGSDVTGALVARAVNADLYENWTDVSGLMEADPRIIPDARPVEYIS